jgi:hypothetical protein
MEISASDVKQIIVELSERLALRRKDVNALNEYWEKVLMPHSTGSLQLQTERIPVILERFAINKMDPRELSRRALEISRLALLKIMTDNMATYIESGTARENFKLLVQSPNVSHGYYKIERAWDQFENRSNIYPRYEDEKSEFLIARYERHVPKTASNISQDDGEKVVVLKAVSDALRATAAELSIVNDRIETALNAMEQKNPPPDDGHTKGGSDGRARASA